MLALAAATRTLLEVAPTLWSTRTSLPRRRPSSYLQLRIDEDAEKTEQTFVIKKVSYRYAYQSGRYVMVGKEAGVKKASRDATDAFLQRMLPDESGRELE